MERNIIRDFLVCETFKKQDGEYPELNLLPLRKDSKYGQLFLGQELVDDVFTFNDNTNYVWRFSEEGYIEKAEHNGALENLDFEETDYRLCTGIVPKSLRRVFGDDYQTYKNIINQFGQRAGRIQRYVSPHPQLDRIKGRLGVLYEKTKELIENREIILEDMPNVLKKIAPYLLVGTMSVSAVAGLINLATQENIVATVTRPERPRVEEKVELSEMDMGAVISEWAKQTNQQIFATQPTATPKPNVTPIVTELPKSIGEVEVLDIVVPKQKSENDLRLDNYSESILGNIAEIQNSGDTTSKSYNFFYKYSSTLNPNLVPYGKGEFASIEELLDSYYEDPQRFAIFANRFLGYMSLDYMKIQLSEIYGIKNPGEILLTYEEPIGAYEARVRHNGKDLEVPGFGVMMTSPLQPISRMDKIFTGSRPSRLPLSTWSDFFKIKSLEGFTNYGINSGQYTYDTYNGAVLDSVGIITEQVEELSPVRNTQTHENDYDER